ncbi:uncharacterized protein LOC129616364, partial [Condylostylus longicornis]|uniref:uncharacterized protein LOC129616364 n=1 Tax=Condylostylus longicornis TaxID=2530218 RepID=UPI00244DB00B
MTELFSSEIRQYNLLDHIQTSHLNDEEIRHSILTKNEISVYSKLYRYRQVHKEEVDKQIEEMLRNKIIQHSNSPYNAPIWGKENQIADYLSRIENFKNNKGQNEDAEVSLNDLQANDCSLDVNQFFTTYENSCRGGKEEVISTEITKVINNCDVCQIAKHDRNPPKIPFQISETPHSFNDIVHMDIWYPERNKMYLTTKLNDRTWISTLDCIKQRIQNLGKMKELVSDGDTFIIHRAVILFLKENDIDFHPITPGKKTGFSYNYDSPINSQPNISFEYNFSRADFVGLNNYFFTVDFETLLCNVPIDEAVKKFYDVVLHGFDMYVPKTRNKSIDSSPVWFSIELKKLRNKKNKAWRKYVKTQSSESYSTYINLFYSFKRLCEVSYSNYLSGCSLELKQNPKSFWKFVNSKRKSNQFPNFMTYALNNDCFPGPDNILEIILKQCSRVLSKPISTLFNRSISEDTFPSWWKTSFIRPVHKKGEKKNIENYRPIAKLSSIPKVFELMVYDVIYNYCSELVVPNQHGFLKMKSTVTNLVECSSKFLNTMEAGSQTDVIYTDQSKAFDLLPHNVVLFKLEKYGFPPFFIKWIGFYLCSRKYGVIFRSYISNYFVANSGVPQGSHLGPLLFIISINDVTRVLKHSDLSIYADDMKIYRRIDSATDTLLCSVVSYTRRSVTITSNYVLNKANLNRVSSIKDLGVVFDEKLTFRQHYNAVISKANSVLGFVKRYTKEFNDPYVIKTLFVALVRPHLEYASQ